MHISTKMTNDKSIEPILFVEYVESSPNLNTKVSEENPPLTAEKDEEKKEKARKSLLFFITPIQWYTKVK